MDFNNSKFESMRYGKPNISGKSSYQDPGQNTIEEKVSVTDLGIIMANNLNFTTHIKNIISKGKRMAAWALRTIKARDVKTMKTLLQSLIISQLEYASVIWSPTDQHSINQIVYSKIFYQENINISKLQSEAKLGYMQYKLHRSTIQA